MAKVAKYSSKFILQQKLLPVVNLMWTRNTRYSKLDNGNPCTKYKCANTLIFYEHKDKGTL